MKDGKIYKNTLKEPGPRKGNNAKGLGVTQELV